MTWDEGYIYYGNHTLAEKIAEFDLREPDYSFDIILVLRHRKTGDIFIGFDSGCSCPTPFEDHTFPDDFTRVNEWREIREYVNTHSYGEPDPIPAGFRSKVVHALRKS